MSTVVKNRDQVRLEWEVIIADWASEQGYCNLQIQRLFKILDVEYLLSLPVRPGLHEQNNPAGLRFLWHIHAAKLLRWQGRWSARLQWSHQFLLAQSVVARWRSRRRSKEQRRWWRESPEQWRRSHSGIGRWYRTQQQWCRGECSGMSVERWAEFFVNFLNFFFQS